MKYSELVAEANTLRSQIDELRSAAYITVECTHENTSFFFIASFDVEECAYKYDITDAGFVEIKGLAQLPAPVLVEYGRFVDHIIKFTEGHPLKYHTSTEIKPLSVAELAKRTQTRMSEDDIDDTDAELR